MSDVSTDLLDTLLSHLSSVGGSGLVVSTGIRPRMHVEGEVISIEDFRPVTCEELLESLNRVRCLEVDNAGRSLYVLDGHPFILRSWTDAYGTTAVVRTVEWVDEDNEA